MWSSWVRLPLSPHYTNMSDMQAQSRPKLEEGRSFQREERPGYLHVTNEKLCETSLRFHPGNGEAPVHKDEWQETVRFFCLYCMDYVLFNQLITKISSPLWFLEITNIYLLGIIFNQNDKERCQSWLHHLL